MDPFIVKAIQLILSLSLLIILHEMGHFIPAKLFKTRVEKFFLFFDVKFALFKKKIGDTVYGIGWLPLGGYVKISGMIDESMDKEQMAQPPKEWEFRSKPAWQRLIIMLGGVTVNLILGFLIYMMIMFVWGTPVVGPDQMPEGFAVVDDFKDYGFQDGDNILKINGKDFEYTPEVNKYLFMRDVQNITVQHPNGKVQTIEIPEDIGTRMWEQGIMQPFVPINHPVIDTVVANTAAEKAGLKKGDNIISFNKQEIGYWHEIAPISTENEGKEIEIVFERDGEILSKKIQPDDEGKLGIAPITNIKVKRKAYGFLGSVKEGFDYGYWTLRDYVYQFKYIFTKKGASQLGGFGAIGGLFPDTWNWFGFWHTTALLSIILAFMNILPIPALDGGHVMFLLYEMVTGRKPNDKFMEIAQMVGFFLLIALVLYANGNDIYRWLFE